MFLFDEPLSNLDAKLRTEMRLEIKKLHDELSSTIVYVTHDQIEAMTMATKIAVMNGGVIQQFGTPDEIYERPANLFVAGFIGSLAMNMLPATLRVEGGRVWAEDAGTNGPFELSDYAFAEPPENGTEVIVGLRPEHFGPVGQPLPNAAATFELPLQYSERTGSDATAYFSTGDKLMAVRIDPEQLSESASGSDRSRQFRQGKSQCLRRPVRTPSLATSSHKGGVTMRITSKLVGLTAALLMGTTAIASAEELVVYHGWSTPAEVAALTALRKCARRRRASPGRISPFRTIRASMSAWSTW